MNKSKSLLTVLLYVLFSSTSFAQSIEIKAGLNLSTMFYENTGDIYSEDFQLAPRTLLGITADFPITKSFSLESGLLFSSKGYKVDIKNWAECQNGEYIDFYDNSTLNYIDIPMSVKYTFSIKNIQIFCNLGPYVGIGLSGTVEIKEYNSDGQGGFIYEGIIKHKGEMGDDGLWKRLDYGIQGGGGIAVNKIVLRINYGYGLANIAQGSYYTNKNRVFGMSLGYIISR